MLLALLAGSAHADDIPLEGVRVGPVGPGSGVSLAQDSVLGGDGGTVAWTARTRVALDRTRVGVTLPFATYRGPDGQRTGLGNLGLEILGTNEPGTSAVGVAAHIAVGRAYTWVDEAEELWPGTGLDLVWLGLRPGDTTVMWRVAGGLHFSGGIEPFPLVYLKASVAGAVDQAVTDRVGLVGEATLGWWDVSPLEVAGLVRADPVEGLRLRGGLVLPLLSWAGAQPAAVPAGVREATLRVDVTLSL